VLDIDQRAFLAAAKDRNAAGLPPVPPLPRANPAADKKSRLTTGPIVIDPAVYHGSNTSSGFSNESWPVGQHVMNFFWGELALSEGAPFECLTPDGKSTVSARTTQIQIHCFPCFGYAHSHALLLCYSCPADYLLSVWCSFEHLGSAWCAALLV